MTYAISGFAARSAVIVFDSPETADWPSLDPQNWEGEWKNVKRFNRVDDVDIQEVSCLPDLNEHLQSTTSKTQVR